LESIFSGRAGHILQLMLILESIFSGRAGLILQLILMLESIFSGRAGLILQLSEKEEELIWWLNEKGLSLI